jgi:hypothetical protein
MQQANGDKRMNAETANRLLFPKVELTGERNPGFGYPQTIRLSSFACPLDPKILSVSFPTQTEEANAEIMASKEGSTLNPEFSDPPSPAGF